MVAPFGVGFGEGQVGHDAVGCGAVPVPFAAVDVDDVTGADPGDGFAAGLDQSLAFGDVKGLGDRVRVPGGAVAAADPSRQAAPLPLWRRPFQARISVVATRNAIFPGNGWRAAVKRCHRTS